MKRFSIFVVAFLAQTFAAIGLMRGDSTAFSEAGHRQTASTWPWTEHQSQTSIVWIPSWPRAGSTTIYLMALAASWEAEKPSSDVVKVFEDRGRGGSPKFVPEEPPTAPGCWVLAPSDCPGRKRSDDFSAEHWTKDEFEGAHNSRTACENRRHSHNTQCNVTDIAVLFVPGADYKANSFKKHFALFEPCHTRLGSKTRADVVSGELEGNCKLNMERLFSCDFTGMEFLWGWNNPHSDITGVTALGAMPPAYSQSLASTACAGSDLVVYKTVDEFGRNATDVIEMLDRYPKVKALIPVRDPRAIYASWKELGWDQQGVSLLQDICDDMAANAHIEHHRLFRIPFEKLTVNPQHVTREAYNFLGFEYGAAQKRWIKNTFNATCSETARNDQFYSCHANSDSLERWKTVLTSDEKKAFETHPGCIKAAKHYGYDV